MDVLLLLFGPIRADLRACKVKRVSDCDCGSIAPRRSIRSPIPCNSDNGSNVVYIAVMLVAL